MSQNKTFRIVMFFAVAICVVFLYNLYISETSCFENIPKWQKSTNMTKLIIYHMPGCGHCDDIMKNTQQNGKTKFEELKSRFSNDNNVQIIDYQLGRDKEANQFDAFPVIKIVSKSGSRDYNEQRTVDSMCKAIIDAKTK